jgi:hypothetical protein
VFSSRCVYLIVYDLEKLKILWPGPGLGCSTTGNIVMVM